jgi:hypothetical protein
MKYLREDGIEEDTINLPDVEAELIEKSLELANLFLKYNRLCLIIGLMKDGWWGTVKCDPKNDETIERLKKVLCK